MRNDQQGTGVDLFLLRLDADRRVSPLIQTRFNERNADISPDGRWLAYESDESGQSEVYVRPFPAVETGKWQVSTGGGRKALWARDGREIFYYRALDGALLGARVVVAGSATFGVGAPEVLVEAGYATGGPFGPRNYDVAADGRRFLMVKEEGANAGPPSIVVVQHFDEELKRLAPNP